MSGTVATPELTTRLTLRPWPMIALAYVLAPAAGMIALWLGLIVFGFANLGLAPQMKDASAGFSLLFVMMLLLAPVCLALEVVLITPVLVGFRLWRWRWLNGWTAALAGFLVGAIPTWLWEILEHDAADKDLLFGQVLMVAGHRTFLGWLRLGEDCLMMGAVGVAMALTFRFIAVKREAAAS